jgi:hypothetical protein
VYFTLLKGWNLHGEIPGCNAGILYVSTSTYICLKASFSIDTVLSIFLLKVELFFVREWRDGKPALILENTHHREKCRFRIKFFGKKLSFLKATERACYVESRMWMYMVHCTISKQKLNDYKTHSNFLETSRAICTTACAFILISRENIIIPGPVIKAMF